MSREVGAHVAVDVTERQRIPGPRVHVVVARAADLGLRRADRQDRVHHMVTGHDVDDRVR